MSIASSSSSLSAVRCLGRAAGSRPARHPVSIHRQNVTTYSPSTSYNDALPPRPPRPSSPTFFTGRPEYYTALSTLSSALFQSQQSLRSAHIWPLPTGLPAPQPPRASWHSAPILGNLLKTKLKTSSHRRVVELLNELHSIRHIAELTEQSQVVSELDGVLGMYERSDASREGKGKEERKAIDELGRAYGMGRRKEASARVWIIPSKSGRATMNTESSALESADASNPVGTDVASASESVESGDTPSQHGQILINHLPLHQHFPRIADRETILRPLKITGLLGAFNVFALARGGGSTGQAGAVGLGLARALSAMKEDTVTALQHDGALMRDTRMVERKKTGHAKARKKEAMAQIQYNARDAFIPAQDGHALRTTERNDCLLQIPALHSQLVGTDGHFGHP